MTTTLHRTLLHLVTAVLAGLLAAAPASTPQAATARSEDSALNRPDTDPIAHHPYSLANPYRLHSKRHKRRGVPTEYRYCIASRIGHPNG
jgi:ABC-type sugar transport system substrate-binding protein